MPDFVDWNRNEILNLVALLLVVIGTVAGVAAVRHKRTRQALIAALALTVIIAVSLFIATQRRAPSLTFSASAPTTGSTPQDPSPAPTSLRGSVTETHQISEPPGCVEAVINDPDHYTNIRVGPGLQHEVVTRLMEDEVFCVHSQEGRWWKISAREGLTGYIYYDRVRLRQDDSQ